MSQRECQQLRAVFLACFAKVKCVAVTILWRRRRSSSLGGYGKCLVFEGLMFLCPAFLSSATIAIESLT